MKNIIVLCGGKSAEREISLITANLVLNSIDEQKFKVYPIVVDELNRWHYIKNFKNDILSHKGEQVFLKMGENVLYKKVGLILKKLIQVDCAILCHHGLNGEDGTIQGVLELCNIPYTSSNVLSSSITMDKVFMKLLFKEFKINVIDYDYFTKFEYENSSEEILNRLESKLDYPIIIKPANLGSSIGINIAKNRKELIEAIIVAFSYDNKILAEKALTNFKEINCAVLGYKNNIIVSSLEEPVSWKEFLTFDEKYINSNKKYSKRTYPAKLNSSQEEEIKNISRHIFEKFELSGVVRIDYIVTKNKIYVNEINSIPGSLAYYLFEEENLCFTEIIDKLINFAIEKNKDKNSVTYAYKSEVLANKNIVK